MNGEWAWTADDAPWAAVAIGSYGVPFAFQFIGAFRRQLPADELRRITQRRVVRIDDDLRDDGCDLAWRSRATQRVVDGLLYHIPNPSGSCGHEHAQR